MGADDAILRIAVVGAGLIGSRHARLLKQSSDCELAAIVEPNETAQTLARELSAPLFKTFEDLLAADSSIDGIIVATPNAMHKNITLHALAKNIPCLVEKPLADNSIDASEIERAALNRGVPVLVGHHRRYHCVSRVVRDYLKDGSAGKVVGAQVTWCLRKPDDYFQMGAWRTTKGGGPIWINLIHEIDLLRYFLGEVSEVFAVTSNSARGFEVEDTASISLRMASGALVSVLLSDTAPSPWHFEGGSAENPNIAVTKKDGMRIFGTRGALEFPSARVWKHDDAENGHWGELITASSIKILPEMDAEAALVAQLNHFSEVIKGQEKPLISANDGLMNIKITEAILKSAQSGRSISID